MSIDNRVILSSAIGKKMVTINPRKDKNAGTSINYADVRILIMINMNCTAFQTSKHANLCKMIQKEEKIMVEF